MKLKQFDMSNSASVRMGVATMRFASSPGTISFSKRASEVLDLSEGSRILILQDEEKPTDWYVTKTEDENGFELRDYNKRDKTPSYMLNSAFICKSVLDSLGITEKSVAFRISTEPEVQDGMELYSIITRNPLS